MLQTRLTQVKFSGRNREGEKMKNRDMPAYGEMRKCGDLAEVEGGFTKREYLAAMAMQGYCAAPDTKEWSVEYLAEASVRQADALLAELEKGQ